MTVYPNPTSDLLTIELSDEKNLDFVITDLTGAIVSQGGLVNGKRTIETAGFSRGTYVISLFDDSQMISSKQFIVNR